MLVILQRNFPRKEQKRMNWNHALCCQISAQIEKIVSPFPSKTSPLYVRSSSWLMSTFRLHLVCLHRLSSPLWATEKLQRNSESNKLIRRIIIGSDLTLKFEYSVTKAWIGTIGIYQRYKGINWSWCERSSRSSDLRKSFFLSLEAAM